MAITTVYLNKSRVRTLDMYTLQAASPQNVSLPHAAFPAWACACFPPQLQHHMLQGSHRPKPLRWQAGHASLCGCPRAPKSTGKGIFECGGGNRHNQHLATIKHARNGQNIVT